MRRRDWHILSSGVFTYTNDERFQILHSEGSDDWTLQIKYVQKRDNGTYECQVSRGCFCSRSLIIGVGGGIWRDPKKEGVCEDVDTSHPGWDEGPGGSFCVEYYSCSISLSPSGVWKMRGADWYVFPDNFQYYFENGSAIGLITQSHHL